VGTQAADGVVADQDKPVLEHRRLAPALAAGRVVGKLEAGVAEIAQPGAREIGASGRERRKENPRGARSRIPVPDAADHPRPEREVLLARRRWVVQAIEHVREADVALGQPCPLGAQRSSEVRQLLIRGEVTVADYRRRRDLEIDRSEQLGVERRLIPGELARRGRGQTHHVHLTQRGDHHPNQIPPERAQVVALVEHERADSLRSQSCDPLAYGRRNQRRERHLEHRRARDLCPLPEHALGCRRAQSTCGVRGPANRLVGEHVQRSAAAQVRVRRVSEQSELLGPLRCDRRRRREHQSRAPKPPHNLQTDNRLPGARRRHHVCRGPSRRPVRLKRFERQPLIGAQRAPQHQLGELSPSDARHAPTVTTRSRPA